MHLCSPDDSQSHAATHCFDCCRPVRLLMLGSFVAEGWRGTVAACPFTRRRWRGARGGRAAAAAMLLGLGVLLYGLWALLLHRRGCPVLRGIDEQGRAAHTVPTLEQLFPDHRRGETPHPALYAEREAARQQLGPMYWAVLREPGEPACALVVADATLGAQLFASDGVALGRQFLVSPLQQLTGAFDGLKFAVGESWVRQRGVITQTVLSSDAKLSRARAASPHASACLDRGLRRAKAGVGRGAGGRARVQLVPIVRECLAEFMVTAVLGSSPWPGRAGLRAQLLQCEGSQCGGVGSGGSTFTCLQAPVRREVQRRLQQHYASGGGAGAEEDPDADSLVSAMLRQTRAANGSLPSAAALTVAEVSSNTISFLSAGWETSSLTLLNALWPLAAWGRLPRAERWQARLAREAVEAEAVTAPRPLAAHMLAETLHWRPPVPWCVRPQPPHRWPPTNAEPTGAAASHLISGGLIGHAS
jgi:hypothetical protein